VIGNDVWIGQGARILPGACIGDGVIVGAGAVVQGVIPPYSVVVGNPAKVSRMRFSRADAARLQALAWWDWPIELILEQEAIIMAGDVDALAAITPD
jgi:virginiamycin A acetyltransferase